MAVLSRHALAKDPAQDGLCVLRVVGLPIQRHWRVVWRQDRRLPHVAKVFMEFVRQQSALKDQI